MLEKYVSAQRSWTRSPHEGTSETTMLNTLQGSGDAKMVRKPAIHEHCEVENNERGTSTKIDWFYGEFADVRPGRLRHVRNTRG